MCILIFLINYKFLSKHLTLIFSNLFLRSESGITKTSSPFISCSSFAVEKCTSNAIHNVGNYISGEKHISFNKDC